MYRMLLSLVLLIAPGLAAYSQESAIFAFQGINVIPMDGQHILAEQTVIIRDGRIDSIVSLSYQT